VVDPLWREMKGVAGADGNLKGLFRTAYEVPPASHLRMQQIFQGHVDNAVSKTINLPEEATADEILSLYVEAHRMGLKGTTVFRNRSREYQILSCGTHQICP